MKQIPWRVQLGIVAVAYLAVFLLSAALLFSRYMLYKNHAADVAAAGGMYAGGDLILELMIAGMFLFPTLLLVLVIRKSEIAYTRYSQVALGISLTAPICSLGLIPTVSLPQIVGEICMARLLAFPFVMVGLLASRLATRFPRAKRLTSYALLIEAGTFVLLIGLFVFAAWNSHR